MKEKLFLLSEDEYKKYKDVIHPEKEWWWLRSQGSFVQRVLFVGIDREISETHISSVGGVRPAIYLDKESLSFLPRTKNGKYIKMGRYRRKPIKWQILDEKTGLCLSKTVIDKSRFDTMTRYYADSGIKRYLKYFENYFSVQELSFIKEPII